MADVYTQTGGHRSGPNLTGLPISPHSPRFCIPGQINQVLTLENFIATCCTAAVRFSLNNHTVVITLENVKRKSILSCARPLFEGVQEVERESETICARAWIKELWDWMKWTHLHWTLYTMFPQYVYRYLNISRQLSKDPYIVQTIKKTLGIEVAACCLCAHRLSDPIICIRNFEW